MNECGWRCLSIVDVWRMRARPTPPTRIIHIVRREWVAPLLEGFILPIILGQRWVREERKRLACALASICRIDSAIFSTPTNLAVPLNRPDNTHRCSRRFKSCNVCDRLARASIYITPQKSLSPYILWHEPWRLRVSLLSFVLWLPLITAKNGSLLYSAVVFPLFSTNF